MSAGFAMRVRFAAFACAMIAASVMPEAFVFPEGRRPGRRRSVR